MTAQAVELIVVNGTYYAMHSDPLESYERVQPRWKEKLRDGYSTACYRNYIGHWSIGGGRLYLNHLECPLDGEFYDLPQIFGGRQPPILADWFTGKLKLQIGEMLMGHYAGWSQFYEAEHIVHIAKGIAVKERFVDTRELWERIGARQNTHLLKELPGEDRARLLSGVIRVGWPVDALGNARPYLYEANELPPKSVIEPPWVLDQY